jgi:hypothetical protein
MRGSGGNADCVKLTSATTRRSLLKSRPQTSDIADRIAVTAVINIFSSESKLVLFMFDLNVLSSKSNQSLLFLSVCSI